MNAPRFIAFALAVPLLASCSITGSFERGPWMDKERIDLRSDQTFTYFHSSDYDYGSLVVSGYKAQYRGTGDINGVPGYKFVLTAYDGDVNGGGGIDKFRMKITKNGVVVYDNRLGASDDIDLANPLAISGGSIVIHK